jgi:hypothetical protein
LRRAKASSRVLASFASFPDDTPPTLADLISSLGRFVLSWKMNKTNK